MMGRNPALDTVKNVLNQQRVRISFDIDDTLACQPHHSAAEDSKLPECVHRWLGEPLRHGHALAARGSSNAPSKLPTAFDIDLHVDDSEGVQIEGYDHGFRVVVVRPDDEPWAHKVLEAVARVQAQVAWHSDRAGTRCLRRSIRVSPLTAEGFQELCVLQHLGKHRQRELLGGLLLFAGEGCRAVGQGDHVVALLVA